ncbi:MAG: SufS family cysteine desulfurase [Deltaproteobacteria bacterium]|nr:SufS family cysteine desulfurase [Deltaproteobacteria bacterium]
MTFNADRVAQQFSILNRRVGDAPLHYMDSAATAQMPDSVIDAVAFHDRTKRANVKRGIHLLSEEADEAYEDAREVVANYMGVSCSEEVIFTSGTTAGINLLAHSLGEEMKPGDEVLISLMEHHSNIIPWQMLKQRKGITLRFLPVTPEGRIDLTDLDFYITSKTKLVAVAHGSNVTGSLTDVATLKTMAHERGAAVALDGAQTAPHGKLDIPSLGVDYYVFSGHKVYGPSGIGILWGRKQLLEKMVPFFGGGEMIDDVKLEGSSYASPPQRFEAGTPPITQAVGLAAALQWLGSQDIEGLHVHLNSLTDKLIEGLEDMDRSQGRICVLGPPRGEARLPLVSFSVRDIHPHDICQFLNDYNGVALRGGHHCAQPLHDFFGLDGTSRASLAAYNRQSDIDAFLDGIKHCISVFG